MTREDVLDIAAAIRENAAATREWIAFNTVRDARQAQIDEAYLTLLELQIRKLNADATGAEDSAAALRIVARALESTR